MQRFVSCLPGLLALQFLSIGCTASASDADRAGSGSGTLLVVAEVDSDSDASPATSTSPFVSNFSVRVERTGGAAATDAVVKMRSSQGEVLLTRDNNDRYRGAQNGYLRTYELEVVAGSDSLSGVRLTGPEIHRIDAPTAAQQATRLSPLTVKWSPSGADEAELESDDFDKIVVPDTGSYTIPGASIQGDEGKSKEDRVQIWRTNSQLLEGGLTGSRFRITVRNQVDFVVVP